MARLAMQGFIFFATLRFRLCPAVNLLASSASGLGIADLGDDVTSQLWDGTDVSPEIAQRIFPKNSSMIRDLAAAWEPDMTVAKKLVLMGPMDSGTHLMSWLLSHNYPSKMHAACGMTFEGCRYLWKHSLDIEGVYDVLHQTIGQDMSDTVVIAMVRTPIAQVVGWRKDPWDLSDCVGKPWEEMRNKCHAPLAASTPEGHAGMASTAVPNMDFPNTMGVYNRYLNLYTKLRADGRFKHVAIVAYEDVVLTPVHVLHNLATSLGWGASWHIEVPNTSEKGDRGLSRRQAIDKIVGRSFLQGVQDALPVLCPLLNRTLASNFKEGRYAELNPEIPASAVRQYTYDCRDYLY